VDAGVEVLAGLVRGLVATPESRQQVRDARSPPECAPRWRPAHPDTRKYRLTVEADRGVIRLEGTAALERAAEVARAVPGVVDVKGQLLEVPPIPPFVA
jgi:BON domain